MHRHRDVVPCCCRKEQLYWGSSMVLLGDVTSSKPVDGKPNFTADFSFQELSNEVCLWCGQFTSTWETYPALDYVYQWDSGL